MSAGSPFRAVVFDLDGTLIDSAPDVHANLNRVLAEAGWAPLTLAEVKTCIGAGARPMMEKALGKSGRDLGADRLADLVDRFLAAYGARPAEKSRLFPGALELLDRLRADGVKMGICTNKPTATTGPVIEAFGLAPYFEVVLCGDAVAHQKPDRRHLLATLEAMGAGVGSSIMVGDSASDIAAARAAGVASVAVSFGYSQTPPGELGADLLIHRLSELPQALAGLIQAPAS